MRRTWAGVAALTLLLAGCSIGGSDSDEGLGGERDQLQGADGPTAWGPMQSEVDRAWEIVGTWDADRLAGQLIVARYHGYDAKGLRTLVQKNHLAGASITSENVVDERQVRSLTEAVATAVEVDGRDFPAVIGVDHEGGVVSHLRGVATDLPAYETAGEAIGNDFQSGREAVRSTAYTTGLELRDLGFTWVFAPVADVTVGPADPTIGTRSPSSNPKLAQAATRGAVNGYQSSGIVSTTKHFPGHGSARSDSHFGLPTVSAPMSRLLGRDLAPFETAVAAGAGAIMIGHLDVEAMAPGGPSSLQPETYRFLREQLGFQGVAITDSMGMGAVASRQNSAVEALRAGADLLLMPADADAAHANISQAIQDGRLPRARAEEAASRVIALQLWQQRIAKAVAVPGNVDQRAAAAAARLSRAAG